MALENYTLSLLLITSYKNLCNNNILIEAVSHRNSSQTNDKRKQTIKKEPKHQKPD